MAVQLRLNRGPEPSPAPAQGTAPRRLSLEAILGGDREVIIQHRGEDYRLRLTSKGKLLLTK